MVKKGKKLHRSHHCPENKSLEPPQEDQLRPNTVKPEHPRDFIISHWPCPVLQYNLTVFPLNGTTHDPSLLSNQALDSGRNIYYLAVISDANLKKGIRLLRQDRKMGDLREYDPSLQSGSLKPLTSWKVKNSSTTNTCSGGCLPKDNIPFMKCSEWQNYKINY